MAPFLFLLTSDELNILFFLACSATKEAGFQDSLVSKEKEEPVPAVRFIPWLVSGWQNSIHLNVICILPALNMQPVKVTHE